MDPKTKAMLHTQGAVLASNNASFVNSTKVTAFPPAVSYEISNHMMQSASQEDQKHIAAMLAQQIGEKVGHWVEDQILSAWSIDAKEAMGIIQEALSESYKNPHTIYMPNGAKHDFGVSNSFHISSSEPKIDWSIEDYHATWKFFGEYIKDETFKVGLFLGPNPPNKDFGWADGYFANGGQISVSDESWSLDSALKWMWGDVQKPAPMTEATKNQWTATFHDLIPGFSEMKQCCPVTECKMHQEDHLDFLQNTIIHLNDRHKWSREQIADWLETLDHDLTFKTPEEVKNGDAA